jgi:hypothetical protein
MSDDPKIDFSVWFMPQHLTPLYFTAVYGTLTEAQRLRYNQLHALYLNEQTIFFERALAPNVLGYFLAQKLPPKLRRGIEEFAADEERHSAMFRGLNRLCAPEIYGQSDFHFIRVPPIAAKFLRLMSRKPRLFPLLLWLMHLQEERALFYGQQFVKCEHAIEPRFLDAQRTHLADEVSHVNCDKQLLDLVWPRTNALVRLFNVRLLAWLMEEYFGAPKRAQLDVISQLILEFPDLQSRTAELRAAMLGLAENREFMRSMYSRENVPDVFERFDKCPELHPLARALPGYEPNSAS